MSLVSVIIVNYNGGPLLVECVRSVLASTTPVEVLVSDNRSCDGSIAMLRRAFPAESRLTIIENPENLGFAKANNIALARACGDYILFLNPDCLIRPDTIEATAGALAQHPGAGLAGCLIRNLDGSEQAGCRRRVPTPWRTFIRLARLHVLARFHQRFDSYVQTDMPMPDEPVYIEAISGAFMFARREAIAQVGVMDEGYFMHCEDLDWCMRFRQAGMSILFIPHIQIVHVGGVCSASRPLAVEYYKHKGMIRFYRKFFRNQYPLILMWLVMLAVSLRFLLRVAHEAALSVFSDLWSDKSRAVFEESGEPTWAGTPRHKVLVTGATSLIGDFLLPALLKAGCEVHAVSRKAYAGAHRPGCHWHVGDISDGRLGDAYGADVLIHLAPLVTLPALLDEAGTAGIKRIIAFSSTSRFTKQDSGYEKERAFAQTLQQSEADLARISQRWGMAWTIFRPTLVYKMGRDKNVSSIARFIRCFGFFPLVGDGHGRRQPVHAADLAAACVAVLDNPETCAKAYNLSGGETLSYREMVERIFISFGMTSRIVPIPLAGLRVLLKGLSLFPRYRHLTPEMANRINRDMCFEHDDAVQDFGFEPRCFRGEALDYRLLPWDSPVFRLPEAAVARPSARPTRTSQSPQAVSDISL